MPQPIALQALQEVAAAYKIFAAEMRAIRLDTDQLIRDIIARTDAERVGKAYEYLKSLIYERGNS